LAKQFYTREELEHLKAGVPLRMYLEQSGVSLQAAGRAWRALCPLHAESSPSFTVYDNESFHCFGCQRSGDIYTLVQALHGLDFHQAVQRVQQYAQMNGKAHAPDRIPPRSAQKHTMGAKMPQQLLENVVAHYHARLQTNPVAQHYLAGRKISETVLSDFSLGFADGYLRDRFPHDVPALEGLGLVNAHGADTFYRRVIVPIRDVSEAVSQLYGRRLSSHQRHRYLPGPHTSLFHPPALQARSIILCESILDALTLHSFGWSNAAAVYGAGGLKPAFVEQIASAGVQEVMLAYDADPAGEKGSARAAALLRAYEVSTQRLPLPEGLDVNAFAAQSPDPTRDLQKLIQRAKRVG